MTVRWSNLAALCMAPACVAAVAPFMGRLHWTLDLLACFPAQALFALLVGISILAVCRKWLLTSVLLPFAALAAWAFLPGLFAKNNFPDIGENAPQLRVLSLNLLHSNGLGRDKLIKVVRDLAPDLLWCSEYTPLWQSKLRLELPDFPYRCEQPTTGPFGAALFSRHPLPLKEMVALGHDWTPGCRAVVQTPHGLIGFLGVHPPPPGLAKHRSEERDEGLAAIPRALQNLPERRIVCGDFNATPWNASFQELREKSGLSRGSTTSWLPSWPASLPLPLRIPIDHVLVSGKLTVLAAHLGPDFHSDHMPLLAVVGIVE